MGYEKHSRSQLMKLASLNPPVPSGSTASLSVNRDNEWIFFSVQGEVGNAISKLPNVEVAIDVFMSLVAEEKRLFSHYTYNFPFYTSDFRLEFPWRVTMYHMNKLCGLVIRSEGELRKKVIAVAAQFYTERNELAKAGGGWQTARVDGFKEITYAAESQDGLRGRDGHLDEDF